jgi:hypothetical protein
MDGYIKLPNCWKSRLQEEFDQKYMHDIKAFLANELRSLKHSILLYLRELESLLSAKIPTMVLTKLTVFLSQLTLRLPFLQA